MIPRIELRDADNTLLICKHPKRTWKDVKAMANVLGLPRRPRDNHKEFKWDAVRFANKVYAVFETAKDPKH